MRRYFIFLFLAMLLALGYKYYRKATAPPPAPAPMPLPPILTQPPAPILNSGDLEKVLESTKDIDPNVRWQALKFLVQINAPQADSLTYEMLRMDFDTNVRRNIVTMLGEHPGPKSSLYLVKALADPERDVRMAALDMLEKTGDYATAPAISGLLHDIDSQVRLKAMSTLNALQKKHDDMIRKQLEEELRRRKEAEQRAARGEK